mgnify:CR=1 FL=1
MVKVPGNKLSVIIQGLARVKVDKWEEDSGHLKARLRTYQPDDTSAEDVGELMRNLRELAQKIIDAAVQIHGGSGYMQDTEINRLYRANKLLEIGAGTSEVRKIIIAEELLRA